MYIFIKDNIPDNMAPVVAAHASLSCYLTFEKNVDMIKWRTTSFKKVVCRVNDKEFEELKNSNLLFNVTTESSLGGKEVAITFCPIETYPKNFKNFKLWKPIQNEVKESIVSYFLD